MLSDTPRLKEILNFASIFCAAGLIVAVHFLVPDSIHQALVFDHGRFRIYTLWTAAYVHISLNHLLSNLLGYLLATLYIFVLCAAVGEQRWFRRTFVLFLTILPILVSISSYAIFTVRFPGLNPTSQGFSGITAGFGGFLLVALAVYVKNQYSKNLAQVIGVSVFLILMLIVDIIYSGHIRLTVSGLVLLGIVLQIGTYIWKHGIELRDIERRQLFIDGGALILVFVVLAYIVVALFPADVVSDGRTTNIFAHGVGFLTGIAISYLSYQNSIGKTTMGSLLSESPKENAVTSSVGDDQDGQYWIFLAPVLSAYFIIVGAGLALEHLPKEGNIALFTKYYFYMVYFSAALVFFRRFVDVIDPVIDGVWGDMTIEGDNTVQLFPSWDRISRGFSDVSSQEKYDGVSILNVFAASTFWLSLGFVAQILIIIALSEYLGTPFFENLASQYGDNQSVLPGFLALITPIVAVFVLILQSFAGDPGSALVILLIIGLPAVFLAPAVQNLATSIEVTYVRSVSLLSDLFSNQIPNQGSREALFATSLSLLIVFLHLLFIL